MDLLSPDCRETARLLSAYFPEIEAAARKTP
jgi:hypothetical protein